MFDTKSKTVIENILKSFIKKFGPPEKILSDRGSQFIAQNSPIS
jgi:hypothetical protein